MQRQDQRRPRPSGEIDCWTSPRTRAAGGSGAFGIPPAGVATVNSKLPLLAPAMIRLVLTVTTSPAVNGLLGRKLPPSPSESERISPVWEPLRAPVNTLTVGTPRTSRPSRPAHQRRSPTRCSTALPGVAPPAKDYWTCAPPVEEIPSLRPLGT